MAKTFPIGGEVKERADHEISDRETLAEREDRIRDFVRVLREGADEWETTGSEELIRQICEKRGTTRRILNLVLSRVKISPKK